MSVAAHIKLQVLFFCTFKDKDPETLFPKKEICYATCFGTFNLIFTGTTRTNGFRRPDGGDEGQGSGASGVDVQDGGSMEKRERNVVFCIMDNRI